MAPRSSASARRVERPLHVGTPPCRARVFAALVVSGLVQTAHQAQFFIHTQHLLDQVVLFPTCIFEVSDLCSLSLLTRRCSTTCYQDAQCCVSMLRVQIHPYVNIYTYIELMNEITHGAAHAVQNWQAPARARAPRSRAVEGTNIYAYISMWIYAFDYEHTQISIAPPPAQERATKRSERSARG